ncbi:iron-containing alcohol dehydrogenase [gamma proteobacterium BDW918]|jgi:NADP-dependent alcohol dehydrogenase|uniref:Aldehyde reductase n=1 Tax=Zhongshania aliphaticivorans TaxID=1470434 RepID=A0A127M584_9GAMM|nr:iron-containing alcohol dehydrogenase [Zhongshania aliphaticivorans]AMO68351.1 aldehyde reductase [Zhongshania aliphaticivorans]EIF44247.1 iron-containing alcohol dehydrogenase [gamma proteobacterium BDW918]|tara:strand:- start:1097 stop:2254 length:1158 start_codon:yes stop_codon:yes gene_type:complete
MLNFSFSNVTRIHFGEGQIQVITKEIPADAKILLVYGGGSIKNNGIYEQLSLALTNHSVVEFSGIEPNPSYETLMKAQALITENNLDYILAVGGGSVVDGAKFIAAAACYDGEDPWDIIAKRQRIRAALDIGVVLTLPATGSESNAGAVVTRHGHKGTFSSPLVRPKFAVLDPAVTLSLSDRQIGNGVVDAFVHTMEQYLTYSVNAKVQDRFAEGLLQTLIEEGPKALALATKNDLAVRGNIMWAASLALNGLIGAGVPQDWTTHMIGHELTAAHGIDHARTLSIVLPAVLKVRRSVKRAKLLQYADRVWGIRDGDEEARIDQAIAATEAFFSAMGLPVRLAEVDLGAEHIDELLAKLTEHGMVKLGEQGEVTPLVSRQILEMAL